MRIRLTPHNGEPSKFFEVVSADFDTAKGELILVCRDGRICLGLQGAWTMSIQGSFRRPMSCDEAERAHNSDLLVLGH